MTRPTIGSRLSPDAVGVVGVNVDEPWLMPIRTALRVSVEVSRPRWVQVVHGRGGLAPTTTSFEPHEGMLFDVSPSRSARRRHCTDAEWAAYVAAQGGNRQYQLMKLRFRRQFVERWPTPGEWFAAPLIERVGRLRGESFHRPSYPVSFRARTYLIYLGLCGHATFDYPWLFAPGQLPIVEPAAALGIDLGAKELVDEAIALGFNPNFARQAMHWSVSRIAVHTGIFDVTAITNEHIVEVLQLLDQGGALQRGEHDEHQHCHPRRDPDHQGADRQCGRLSGDHVPAG